MYKYNVTTNLCDEGKNCTIIKYFNLTNDINQEILIMYQLDNFIQNHRELISHRNNKQLKGENVINIEDLSKSCNNTM